MIVERSTEAKDRLDLLNGKIVRYRSGRMSKEDQEEVYQQIIALTAQEMIDRKGEVAPGILFQIASSMDSLGFANQRLVAKVSGDVAGKIAEIAYRLQNPPETPSS